MIVHKMVAEISTCGTSSDLYNQNKCDLRVSECLNCVLLEKQLRSALEKVESTKLIIKLLQKGSEDFPRDDGISEAVNSPSDMSAKVCSNRIENNKWTVTTPKCSRKVFSTKNLTEANNTFSLSVANRYQQLINLQDMLENDTTLMTQGENNTSEIPSCDHQTKLQHQSRERIQQIDKKNKEDFQIYHIPTLITAK